ncbi:glycoside hydrolase superfamily [Aspergillus keveii]|uniref:glucan 1,3-beta-glucosidase n=1 Tax=Aspergillus keveii TaxID=714993 RepID=A0ABR4GLU4_9EURO
MPSQSRSRDRYGRDRERDRSRVQSRRRYHEDDYDEGDEDFEDSPRDRRYRREGYRRARAGSRAYDSYDDYDGDHRKDVNVYDRSAEDSRRYRSDTEGRRQRPRATASPTASPRKRERTRDRDSDHRRRRTDEEDDSSPAPRAHRDRRSRTRDAERSRGLEEDEEAREAARKHRRREREREREKRTTATSKHQSAESSNSSAGLLKADALARLREQYEEEDRRQQRQAEKDAKAERKRRRKRPVVAEQSRTLEPFPDHVPRGQSKGRIVSGAYLEEGRSPEMEVRLRGGGRGPPTEQTWEKLSDDPDARPPFWKRKKWWWIGGAIAVVLVIVIIVVAVVVSKNDDGGGSSDSSTEPSDSSNTDLDGISRDSIPESAQGTVLDPWTWYDTTDFNLTYTSETVGGLSVMGLNSTWDDSARANDNVPPLNKPFPYGTLPIRGVNIGGWLSLEPWITPSLFRGYSDDVIDEYTLSQQLGDSAAETIEKHYATFITEQDFADIRDAGLDHVRIPFSYWAVSPIDGEPYVPKISWRYLLRAIEYCRKYGLRVKLDPHGLPGSQNGFNHSGKQGSINWLNGDDGDANAQRSLDFHDKVSKFFSQDRYKNVVAIYGLANEPYMLSLDIQKVLNWTSTATELVQKNGISAWVAFHDGFLNLSKWKSMLKSGPSELLLDTHQYTIFNTAQIVLNHTAKVNLVCNDWHAMIGEINTTSAGWGPTICGEWSQADTDCAENLNNIGRGTRWEGTYESNDDTQYCPTADSAPSCSCRSANADPSDYSDDYKTFLQTYAEAQMSAFETAMGWFYWTWHAEFAPQWSYKTGWQNGYMPSKAYSPSFRCGDEVPSFGTLAENY